MIHFFEVDLVATAPDLFVNFVVIDALNPVPECNEAGTAYVKELMFEAR
ncbi:hypothetical protein [Curtobacterium sp. 24E2]|nr:hypothetical protein JN350_02430 [Curtobacterium sp. 24E2]